MANIKSAKKRVEVSKKKTLQNKVVKTNLKTVLKKANAAIENNAPEKDETVKLAVKKIDKAVTKGVLHKNTASRRKSQIVKSLNASGQSEKVPTKTAKAPAKTTTKAAPKAAPKAKKASVKAEETPIKTEE